MVLFKQLANTCHSCQFTKKLLYRNQQLTTQLDKVGMLIVVIFIIVITVGPGERPAHLVGLGENVIPLFIIDVDDATHVPLAGWCPLSVIECDLLLLALHW